MSNRTPREYPFEDEPKRRSSRRLRLIAEPDLRDDFVERRFHVSGVHVKTLLRFLRRQVGRSWSEVQAELDARLRALKVDEAIKGFVRRRLSAMVATDAVLDAAGIWTDRKSAVRCALYVDPRSGKLSFQPKRPPNR